LLIQREIDRLLVRLSGVRKMRRLPDLLFVVDVGREEASVHEANLLRIPVVALVDTNCNPQGIDYVIPSNDDAIRAIKLLVAKVADAVLEGKAMRKDQEPEEPVELTAEGGDLSHARKTTKVVETDDELEEGALLGESTLAKLSATRKPEDSAAEAIPAEAPISTVPTQESAGAEPVAEESVNAEMAAPEADAPDAGAAPEAGVEGAK
jgi:small subunit ribosomal protein S2